MSVESLPGAALAPAVGLEIDTDSVQQPTTQLHTQLQVQDPSLNPHTPQNDIQLNTHIDINSCSNTFAAPDTATSLLAVRRGDDGSHDASTTTSEQHHGAVVLLSYRLSSQITFSCRQQRLAAAGRRSCCTPNPRSPRRSTSRVAEATRMPQPEDRGMARLFSQAS